MLFKACHHLTFILASCGLFSFSFLHPMKNQKKKETLLFQKKINKTKIQNQLKDEFTFHFKNQETVTFPIEIAKQLPVIASAMQYKTLEYTVNNIWDCESPDSPDCITPITIKQLFDTLNKKPTTLILDQSNYRQTCDFFCRSDLKKLALIKQKIKKKYKLPPKISKFNTPQEVVKILVRTNFTIFNALYGLLIPTYSIMFTVKQNNDSPFFKRPFLKLAGTLGVDTIEIRNNQKHRKTVYIYDKKTGACMPIITHNYPVTSITVKNKGTTIITKTAYEKSGWDLTSYDNKEAKISVNEAFLIHLLTKTQGKIIESMLNLPIKTIWKTIPKSVQKKLLEKFAYRLPKNL